MPVLDDLSGFEFEDVMEDVFRNLGYENVRQAERTADEGRDILMEEVVDGTRRGVVVECKHTGTVGRPVVQKLHSAIATFEFDGPKRGMVATTGRFTGPAIEYAQRLRRNDDPYPIELIDGEDLREIADEIGLDLYNGRIEILCDETLRPYDPATSVTAPVEEAFHDIENIESADLPAPHSHVTFRPVVAVTADTNGVFETSVGVIHRVNDRSRFVVHAERGHPKTAAGDVSNLVLENLHATVDLDAEQFEDQFDVVEERRFGQTQTEYKDWAVDRVRERHTTTVSYTGDNNVTYTKTCEPKRSDISVQSIEPVYLPEIRQTTELREYTYPYEYFTAGPSRVTSEDGIHRCVHCDTAGTDNDYTYCANCGSINCDSHIKTERLEGTPVCTGCAVTERFAFKTKYFYDAENRDAFREEYESMPFYEKAMENTPLAVGTAAVVVLVLLGVLISLGGI
ncbi:Mrr restriction system protein-like protein [Halorubrum coriense DSM 10284]|uniref:Mrr restriction system protein-like protein n=1 Tax=Halorubrum coriense DSM 10284 TaxID=1227466 RepID=M0EQZ2_9EURY|nr:restriction endonuclease [Halorubrum coriense]ELZ48854.1 Mrr restriction system protein-like protein [Halorubrum coriense DSM 10284]